MTVNVAEHMKVYRPSWVEVNLAHVKHNCRTVRNIVGDDVIICAVVKADAYGHGAVEVSKACIEAGAQYLTVAILSEAIALREAGITVPILIMGWTPEEGFAQAIAHDICLSISIRRKLND